jgi:energy-converting hydrogenase B subunit D
MTDAVPITALALDMLLASAIVVVAWRALTIDSAFVAIVLFITFGLLMALAWTRLAAPDIALAEAAIGAGLTGALLIDAVTRRTRRGGGP